MNIDWENRDEFCYEYDDYLPVYKGSEDCFWEILNNMFNSRKVNDENLLDDMRWICNHYDVCRNIHWDIEGYGNAYLDKSYPVEGISQREEYKDVRSAIGELARRLYFGSKIYTDRDMRPLIAYILDQYKMPTDFVDEIQEKQSEIA